MNCCLREAHDLGGCGAQLVREPRTSTMVAAPRRGPSSPALGLQRAYSASQRLISSTGGRRRPSLEAQRHAAKVERRVLGELKRLERQLEDAGLMPDDCD